MHILLSINSVIPSIRYGGAQRVFWSLGKALVDKGHRVTFLAEPGSVCPFTRLLERDESLPIGRQIPEDADVAHAFHFLETPLECPYILTLQGNMADPGHLLDPNTVFVSADHARRHGGDIYVHNGLDWDAYPPSEPTRERNGFHFLGKAAWRKKNVRGAIDCARKAGEPLTVMGGSRLNLKMGFRFTPYPSISFAGMVDDNRKGSIMNQSKGLVFPVRWREPFGLALTESLYFGCPVFGTPYGSLPELIHPDVGLLSTSSDELAEAMRDSQAFSRRACHEYARDLFNANVMADRFLDLYRQVLNGRPLHDHAPHLQQPAENRLLPFS